MDGVGFQAHPSCDAINLWAVTDAFSWSNAPESGLGSEARPMIFMRTMKVSQLCAG
jgi:hypothetical protein